MVFNNRYLIIFNGEIYNYLELKQKLKKLNYKFKTTRYRGNLASYDAWGDKCFNYFNGMWSLIIFDFKKMN